MGTSYIMISTFLKSLEKDTLANKFCLIWEKETLVNTCMIEWIYNTHGTFELNWIDARDDGR
jgi:hypothetical protein